MAARPQGHRALAVPDIRELFYKEVFQCAKSLGFLSSGIFNSSGDFVAGLELPVPIHYFRRAIIILCERCWLIWLWTLPGRDAWSPLNYVVLMCMRIMLERDMHGLTRPTC